ncbi:chaperonin CPN60-like protein 2, mitochondrial [Tanacetum coccineum]
MGCSVNLVATISANGEREIGELIARAIEKVGKDGVITVADDNTLDNELEVVEGMKLGRGYISPYFVTDMQELEHPLIFIHDKKISDMNSLVRILELAVEKRRPLLIVAEDLESELLAMLIINKRQAGLKLSPFENLCFEDGSTADHTVRDVVIKLISDGLENRLLSVIESLLFVAYPESMFWDPDSFVDGPVRCLLYNLEGEFPFRTVELIRLLSALSEGAWPAECVRPHFPEKNTSDYVALEHSERQPDHLEWLLDFGLIGSLLMKNDIDEIGHVMIGHEVGELKQMQVNH